MTVFIVHAVDKPDALDLRMANRPEHLAWVGTFSDRILMAGPLFQEDGKTFAGSCFAIEFDSLEEVREWASNDPYAKAGLFAQVDIHAFNWAIGTGPDD